MRFPSTPASDPVRAVLHLLFFALLALPVTAQHLGDYHSAAIGNWNYLHNSGTLGSPAGRTAYINSTTNQRPMEPCPGHPSSEWMICVQQPLHGKNRSSMFMEADHQLVNTIHPLHPH